MNRLKWIGVGLVAILLLLTAPGKAGENIDVNADLSIYSAADKAAFLAGPYGKLLQRRLLRESLVLVNNINSVLPLDVTGKYAIIHQSNRDHSSFTDYFGRYAAYDRLPWAGSSTLDILKGSLNQYKAIVLLIDNSGMPATLEQYNWWKALANMENKVPILLVHYGDPYHLADINGRFTILQAPNRNVITDELTAQALFGGLKLSGRLPYGFNTRYPDGTGLQMAQSRMAYAIPEEVNIAPEKLVGIDAIANSAIARRATPGCQVVVAKEGKIIYSKAFGYHTYSKDEAVRKTDLYDLASITKVAATTFAAMKLYDAGSISIDGRVGDYWPIEGRSTLKGISLRRLLAHHSGLQSYLPVAPYLRPVGAANSEGLNLYSTTANEMYSVPVGKNMYLRNDIEQEYEELWQHLSIDRYRKYRYSDVNFVVLQKVIESVSQKDLATFMTDEFYKQMGLRTMLFRPYERFDDSYIVPTTSDRRWRQSLLLGYVHDEGAALQGGIAGHAGLFSDAEDLAKLFQLLLNGGIYGNQQYISSATIAAFTGPNRLNSRGLGFDRHTITYNDGGKATVYGHTGFTGTCVWVDPETQLVYVFLSNRIHPDVNNNLLSTLGVRERILKEIYNSFDTFSPAPAKVLEEREEERGK